MLSDGETYGDVVTDEAITDGEIANSLTLAQEQINKALGVASDAGIDVGIEIIDVTNLSSPAKCLRVSLSAARHTSDPVL